MIQVREIQKNEKVLIDEIAKIHLLAFKGFFLSSMGKSFLKNMYLSYAEDEKSSLLVALEDEKAVGFLSYSKDIDELYKFMSKKHTVSFAINCVGAAVKNPKKVFSKIHRFFKPVEEPRKEKYVKLSSIGVLPEYQRRGIGTLLINKMMEDVSSTDGYVSLDTDAKNNDNAIKFYTKNGFIKSREFIADENREMIEFRR